MRTIFSNLLVTILNVYQTYYIIILLGTAAVGVYVTITVEHLG